MKNVESEQSLQLQIDYLEGTISEEDNQLVKELIHSNEEFGESMDNLLLLAIVSGKRLPTIHKEIENSKREFLSRLG